MGSIDAGLILVFVVGRGRFWDFLNSSKEIDFGFVWV